MIEFQHLSVQQYHQLCSSKQATVLDIRDVASFASGHMDDALHIESLPLAAFIAQQDKNQALVICCYHGNSSQQAAAYFVEQGFTEVYSLDGGYEAWAEYKTSTQP
ncbi:MAG: thiosulfate sulfurtransferase GlpE [Mariprofundaceae bacterium]|nr:thiosulfate sulfurtransferase GlpE [Mariprofundaceae bacterium]